jgi:UDP-N-acetylglucosamine--N-acetylmuramyl-(pentapeptide) pyrophosphoryl-undecaprenol N-acetylglucosamine transferase
MKEPANHSHERRACIACGGTGGHLFPGIAVARELIELGCEVTLMISPKDIDHEAVKNLTGMQIVTLPAVGLTRGAVPAFLRGFARSYLASRRHFKVSPPAIALAMGGFTSAPPLLAARAFGAGVFLHESNSVPGRANRWLSRFVREAFIGFPSAAARLRAPGVQVTGTPVRAEFFSLNAARCRIALGLDPLRPVVLVMGGSQGAEGINKLVMDTLPEVRQTLPECQWLHVAGPGNAVRVEQAFRSNGLGASVHGFMDNMELALGAASVAISRAGASSLAELAAVRLPSILIPYPAATDNHQYHNAKTFADSGAARLLPQKEATPAALISLLEPLIKDARERGKMIQSIAAWSAPDAASLIARTMLRKCGLPAQQKRGFPGEGSEPGPSCENQLKRSLASAGEVIA